MSRRIFIRPAARTDILDRFSYLADNAGARVANRFVAAVHSGFERIAELPGVGSPCTFGNARLEGMRAWPVPGFEAIRIYYLTTEGSIRIVRVLHGAMDLVRIFENELD